MSDVGERKKWRHMMCRYRIWHCDGRQLVASPTTQDALFDVCWQPRPEGFYPPPTVSPAVTSQSAVVHEGVKYFCALIYFSSQQWSMKVSSISVLSYISPVSSGP